MKRLALIIIALLLPVGAWGATYYKRSGGTAADKTAATGPCTDLSACMGQSTYDGEEFRNGDVIVHCNTPKMSIPGEVWSIVRKDVSRTLSIPASYVLLIDGTSKFLLVNGTDKLIRP